MKIGLFNDSFPPTIDGVAVCVKNYADCISRGLGECAVVTPKYPNVKDDYPYKVYRYTSIDPKLFEYRVGNMLPIKTLTALSQEKFDLIHVHSPFVSSIVAQQLQTISTRVPLVITYHTKFDIDFEKRLPTKAMRAVAAKLVVSNLNKADEVWTVSEGTAESLRNIGYTGGFRVMPNGTDFKKGVSAPERLDALSKKHCLGNEPILLFVGRMMWYKNIRLILDSLALLNIRYKMIFVGGGNDLDEIREYSKKCGVYNNCVFAGAVSDRETVRDYFSLSDLFLFPSTYDTAGLVVKEAAACECPSLLIQGSCAAEGVIDKRNGYLCATQSPIDYARIIKEALADRKALKTVGETAQNELYLSWDDSVKAAFHRYEEIIENFNSKKGLLK